MGLDGLRRSLGLIRGQLVQQLKDPAGAVPLRTDFHQEVVLDQDPGSLLAPKSVVGAAHVDAAPSPTHDVQAKGDILNRRPRRRPVLVADGKQDTEPALCFPPAVLEDVPLDQDPPGVLELEEVLDLPGDARIPGIYHPPGQGLGEVVLANLDVGRHEVRNGGVRSAKHHVFTRRLEVVIDDLEGAGPVPGGDGLGIGTHFMKISEVGVDDGRAGALHADPASHVPGGRAMHIAAIEDDVGGNLTELGLPVERFERDETGNRR